MHWVVVWSTATGIGGTERRSLGMMAELRARNHLVTSIHLGPSDGQFAKAVRGTGATVVTAANDAGVLRAILSAGGDLVWHMGLRAGLASRTAKLMGRAPILWSAQNGLDALRGRLLMSLDRATLGLVDLIVANSQAAADHASANLGAYRGQVVVVPGGLTREWSAPLPKLRIPTDPVTIAMIGNARPEKRHGLGLATLAGLEDSAVKLKIYTNHAEPILDQLDKYAHTIPLDIQTGHQVAPIDFQAIDILLHPSDSESMPTAILEARSQGTLVIAGEAGDSRLFATHLVERDVDSEWVRVTREAVEDVRAGKGFRPLPPRTTSDYVADLERLASSKRSIHDLTKGLD